MNIDQALVLETIGSSCGGPLLCPVCAVKFAQMYPKWAKEKEDEKKRLLG